MSIGREQAATWTRAVQIGTIVLFALAIALLVLGRGRAEAPPEGGLKVAVAGPVEQPRPLEREVDLVDRTAVASRMALISNRPTPPAPVAPAATPNAVTPAAAAEAKFLGLARMGGRSMALISVAGKQRFVGVGDKVGDWTVESVGENEVLMKGQGAGEAKSLVLAERVGDSFARTRAVASPVATPVATPLNATGFPAARGAGGRGYNPNIPETIPTEHAARFERIRRRLALEGRAGANNGDELNEVAAKELELELIERQRAEQEGTLEKWEAERIQREGDLIQKLEAEKGGQ